MRTSLCVLRSGVASSVLNLCNLSPLALLSALSSGISKPVVWGTRGLHSGFPWVFVISVVSAISTNPTLNSLFVAV